MFSETLFNFMFTETRFEFMFSETLFNFMFTGLMSFGNPPVFLVRTVCEESAKRTLILLKFFIHKAGTAGPLRYTLQNINSNKRKKLLNKLIIHQIKTNPIYTLRYQSTQNCPYNFNT